MKRKTKSEKQKFDDAAEKARLAEQAEIEAAFNMGKVEDQTPIKVNAPPHVMQRQVNPAKRTPSVNDIAPTAKEQREAMETARENAIFKQSKLTRETMEAESEIVADKWLADELARIKAINSPPVLPPICPGLPSSWPVKPSQVGKGNMLAFALVLCFLAFLTSAIAICAFALRQSPVIPPLVVVERVESITPIINSQVEILEARTKALRMKYLILFHSRQPSGEQRRIAVRELNALNLCVASNLSLIRLEQDLSLY